MENRDKEQEQQRNLRGSAAMNRNDERQETEYRENQNQLTRSSNPKGDLSSLAENEPESTAKKESLSLKEQNKRRLESEENRDFGIE